MIRKIKGIEIQIFLTALIEGVSNFHDVKLKYGRPRDPQNVLTPQDYLKKQIFTSYLILSPQKYTLIPSTNRQLPQSDYLLFFNKYKCDIFWQ
jgi:hypothetical protein